MHGLPIKYIGQTGRTFYTRYKEHKWAIRNNNSYSGYSIHMLSTGHAYRNITDNRIMKRKKESIWIDWRIPYIYIRVVETDDTGMTHILTSVTKYLKHCKN
jgi:hypothetical protein